MYNPPRDTNKNNMKFISIFTFLLITILNIYSQGSKHNIDAATMGKAFTGINQSSVFSFFNNQATLAYIDQISSGIAVEDFFLVKELRTTTFATIIPTKYGVFGFGLSYFGFDLFKKKTGGIAYAMPLGEKFAIGLKISYQHLQLDYYYGSASTIIGEIGFTSKPTERLKIGAHIHNPTKAKYNTDNTLTVGTFESIGFSYLFSDNFELMVEQLSDFEINEFRVGGEYKIKKIFILRSGLTISNSITANFGAGIGLNHFIFDIAFGYYELNSIAAIPVRSSVNLIYQF